jgi:hypothetical protein
MLEKTDNLIALSLSELRQIWQELWGEAAHRFISRPMLEKSIRFKQAELRGEGMPSEQKIRLNQLIKQYKRSAVSFDQNDNDLKPGTRLIKIIRDKKYIVTVKNDGLFDYDGKIYSSLSQVAFAITGTRWNGWAFFGLKNKVKK